MFDEEKLTRLLRIPKNQDLKRINTYFDSKEKFDYLLSIKNKVEKDAYAMFTRIAIQTDTYGVSIETLLKVLEGLTQRDLMTKEEICKLEKKPEMLTIYRGTDPDEYPPRLSWSLMEDKARQYDQGQMYRALINKNKIFAYFCSNTNEEEVIAYVTDSFDDIL